MSRHQEEQTQCCWSDECDNIADNAVWVGFDIKYVCDEHKQELIEWKIELSV